jgi:hypothetical protein
LVEGVSRRQIIRKTGMHWGRCKKSWPTVNLPVTGNADPDGATSSGLICRRSNWILQEDLALPRKQRHTAKRIWERLQTEGFTGG